MQDKTERRGWRVAVMAVAAVVAAAGVTAFVATTSASASLDEKASALSSEEMLSILVPLSDQSAAQAYGPMTASEAEAGNAFALPEGMVFEPSSCGSYALGIVGAQQATAGWDQFGTRSASGSLDSTFVMQAAEFQGGADLLQVGEAAATCASGTVTLDGQVTGTVTITERAGPELAGTTTLYLTQTVEFPQTLTPAEVELLKRYNFPIDRPASMHTDYLAVGDMLLVVLEGDADLADQLLTRMYDNLLNL